MTALDDAWETFVRIVETDTHLPVEERIRAALAEIIAPKNELLCRRAELVAASIAERHAVTVAAIFGRSRARSLTPARDELSAELRRLGWREADVAQALGIQRCAVRQGAQRHWERAGVTGAGAGRGSRVATAAAESVPAPGGRRAAIGGDS